MKTLYSVGIYMAQMVIWCLSHFNAKLKMGLVGRRKTFSKLKNVIAKDDKTLWFHCASLGEYEQGLPVFEVLKERYPDHKIVLSFFSPSGYEIRKNASIADVVVYLPLDTPSNAKRFLDLTHPDFIIFVKYEFWPNFLSAIKKRHLRAILVSAVFRENQPFFKWHGRFMRKSLFAYEHIFVQNERSKQLLETIDYNSTSIAGDTRFDRVLKQLKQDNSIPFIEQFKNDKTLIVFGSTWPEDDALILPFINQCNHENIKFLIAPHSIKSSYTAQITSQLELETAVFSKSPSSTELIFAQVYILDTIGYLSKTYSYANITYVGGAAGTTGLHNILEPAVFGIPVVIGKNYKKFPEAVALIAAGGVQSVSNIEDVQKVFSQLLQNPSKATEIGQINARFVNDQSGAVIQITDYIRI